MTRWRRLRLAQHGRARLTLAALTLTVLLALFQGFGMGQWLISLNEPGIVEVSYAQVLLLAASLTGAVALAAFLGRVVNERGLGSGWSVLLGALVATDLIQRLVDDARARPDQLVHSLGGTVLIVGAWAGVLTRHREIARFFGSLNPLPRAPNSHDGNSAPAPLPLPLPASGTHLLGILMLWTTHPLLTPIESPWLHALVVAGTALVLSWCFQRPRYIAQAAAQLQIDNERYSFENLRRSVTRAAVASAAVLVAFAIGMYWLNQINPFGYDVLGWGIVVAVTLDLTREWRATSKADFVPIADLHRVYVASLVSEKLREARIPFVLRGVHHRTIGQVFAPYVPMTVLVERSRAAEALDLVGDIC